MPNTVADVVATAAQAVAKVFTIAAFGFFATQYPRKAPLLAPKAVSTFARFGFNILVIPLIFSSIASSVTVDSLGDYWFLLVGALAILSISFITATALSYLIPIQNERDFIALRLSVTFPNVVALPILIFPSLCEYPVVYEAFGVDVSEDKADLMNQCVHQSTTMIFSYYLVWTLLFFSIGYPTLMGAAHMTVPTIDDNQHDSHTADDLHSLDLTIPSNVHELSASDDEHSVTNNHPGLSHLWVAIKRTLSSPPFITTVVAFAVGCISPLRNLLFSQAGQLHFLGAATETVGQAASPTLTMVVAASLVPDKDGDAGQQSGNTCHNQEQLHNDPDHERSDEDIRNILSSGESRNEDPRQETLPKRKSAIETMVNSIRRSSQKVLDTIRRTPPERRRLHLWFALSRLVLSPLFVVLIIAGLDCKGLLDGVPDLAKLVLVVNASVPGALIIAVVLKSHPELFETAAVVAQVYLPTYILSIATIAGWTALGLLIAIPDNENPFCPTAGA